MKNKKGRRDTDSLMNPLNLQFSNFPKSQPFLFLVFLSRKLCPWISILCFWFLTEFVYYLEKYIHRKCLSLNRCTLIFFFYELVSSSKFTDDLGRLVYVYLFIFPKVTIIINQKSLFHSVKIKSHEYSMFVHTVNDMLIFLFKLYWFKCAIFDPYWFSWIATTLFEILYFIKINMDFNKNIF